MSGVVLAKGGFLRRRLKEMGRQKQKVTRGGQGTGKGAPMVVGREGKNKKRNEETPLRGLKK